MEGGLAACESVFWLVFVALCAELEMFELDGCMDVNDR